MWPFTDSTTRRSSTGKSAGLLRCSIFVATDTFRYGAMTPSSAPMIASRMRSASHLASVTHEFPPRVERGEPRQVLHVVEVLPDLGL